ALENVPGVDAAQGAFRMHDAAMAQHSVSNLFHIIGQHVLPPSQGRVGLAAAIKGVAASGAGSEQKVIVFAGGIDDAHDVIADGVVYVDIPEGAGKLRNDIAVNHLLQRLDGVGASQ